MDTNRIARAIMTCCVLHNLCIDNGETIEMEFQLDDMLSNFQESNNDDGGEIATEDLDTLDINVEDTPVVEDMTERALAALMRNLKLRGQIRRNEVQRSL